VLGWVLVLGCGARGAGSGGLPSADLGLEAAGDATSWDGADGADGGMVFAPAECDAFCNRLAAARCTRYMPSQCAALCMLPTTVTRCVDPFRAVARCAAGTPLRCDMAGQPDLSSCGPELQGLMDCITARP
jgi:hypothetical protein